MNSPLNEWALFCDSERTQYATHDNNRFAFAAAQITRYYDFLSVIKYRYDLIEKEYTEFNKRMAKALEGLQNGPVPPDIEELFKELGRLSKIIQLEIESYYLFAKILLDKIANFVEFYFGAENKISLDSHDKWTKQQRLYCTQKALTVDGLLTEHLQKLKNDIADFRDYQIAHNKSPRNLYFIGMHPDGMKMQKTQLYPKETDRQNASIPLAKLQFDIDRYILLIIELLKTNRRKTKLVLDKQ